MSNSILQIAADGLYCSAGDFFIDPWNPVKRAIITHSHSDHARSGSGSYFTAAPGELVLRNRLGSDARIETAAYGETVNLNGAAVSLHPAGHILGSCQVRVEYRGEVWVASGDYKLADDPTCARFEPIRCHTFITESTFGLPIYRWPSVESVYQEINSWWENNRKTGKASVIFAYALGKAQRILAGVDTSIGPIFAHGAVRRMNQCYLESRVVLPPAADPLEMTRNFDWSGALILAPPSAHNTPWLRRFGTVSTAFASGWMRIRGTRRRKSIDRGFVLSDHADWPGLLDAIRMSGAEQIWVTHGYRAPLVRWLSEQGLAANVVETRWEDDEEEGGELDGGEVRE